MEQRRIVYILRVFVQKVGDAVRLIEQVKEHGLADHIYEYTAQSHNEGGRVLFQRQISIIEFHSDAESAEMIFELIQELDVNKSIAFVEAHSSEIIDF